MNIYIYILYKLGSYETAVSVQFVKPGPGGLFPGLLSSLFQVSNVCLLANLLAASSCKSHGYCARRRVVFPMSCRLSCLLSGELKLVCKYIHYSFFSHIHIFIFLFI